MTKETQKIAIIGGGPAGVMAGIIAMQNANNSSQKFNITVFDKNEPLKTLLYTGGGRCNLSYAEYDFKKLVKFFPRGEKFLLSSFSKFGVSDTQKFFLELGVDTCKQDDERIFPKSNKAEDVRNALLKKAQHLGIKFKKTEIQSIKKIKDKFLISSEKSRFEFDKVVIATGGNRLKPKFSGYSFAKSLGHLITKLHPVLSGLETKEIWHKKLSGQVFKGLKAKAIFDGKVVKELVGDLLFTHKGISGPLSYKTSSYCAYYDFNKNNPLILEINFIGKEFVDFDKELVQKINANQKRNLVGIISEYVSRSMAEALINEVGLNIDIKAGALIKNERLILSKALIAHQFRITGTSSDGEIVTAGGVDLKEVNGGTMESKLVKNLYFCGEVLDVDGLTGGFNLQACWSTGYVVGNNL